MGPKEGRGMTGRAFRPSPPGGRWYRRRGAPCQQHPHRGLPVSPTQHRWSCPLWEVVRRCDRNCLPCLHRRRVQFKVPVRHNLLGRPSVPVRPSIPVQQGLFRGTIGTGAGTAERTGHHPPRAGATRWFSTAVPPRRSEDQGLPGLLAVGPEQIGGQELSAPHFGGAAEGREHSPSVPRPTTIRSH